MNRVFSVAVLAALASSLFAVRVQADTFVSRQPGHWSKKSTWFQNGHSATRIPSASYNDAAVIEHFVDVDGTNSVTCLFIDTGQTLQIISTASLTMGGSTPWGQVEGTLEISGGAFITANHGSSITVESGGRILMDGSNPRLTLNMHDAVVLDNSGAATLVVDADANAGVGPNATINGSGSLRADNDADLIEINVNSDAVFPVQLKLDGATLHGQFRIVDGNAGGGAEFDNQGFVIADVGTGTILLDYSLAEVTDSANSCTNARWQTLRDVNTNSNAILRFETPYATCLVSQFRVLGDLKVDGVGVVTSGSLYLGTNGRVVPLNSGSFAFNGSCSGSCCSSTGVHTITSTVTCGNCP